MATARPDPEGSSLVLSLFGPFEVRVSGTPLRLDRERHACILAYLALQGGRPVERDRLAQTLWPESENPRDNLKRRLWELRRDLSEAGSRLPKGPDRTLWLDLSSARVDALTFDAAITRGDVRSLVEAVDLYRGPLLEGWSELWVFPERQRREQEYLRALQAIASHAKEQNDLETAESYLQRAKAIDPPDEESWRQLLRVLAARAQYAAVDLIYRELSDRLKRYNASPTRESSLLVQQIRAEGQRRLAPSAPPVGAPSPGIHPPRTLPTGTVTILFTDIEGSTPRMEADEEAMIAAILRHNELLQAAIESNEGAVVKTIGDGFCGAFPTARAAVRAALAAQQALQKEEWGKVGILRSRMALHSGDATLVTAPEGSDYLGRLVNRSHRLMGAGHGGQILLSRATQELIRDQLPEGITLRDLGEYPLKGLKHPEQIFQLLAPALPVDFPPLRISGNRETPGDDPKRSSPPLSAAPSSELSETVPSIAGTAAPPVPGHAGEAGLRVVLLYKRNAQPDETLLKLLEAQLGAHGYRVFIDRHMTIGMEWAKEIEREVRTADAVIPLLSAAAVNSEMLHYELQIAHEAAHHQGGKPRLLPVRVAYTGPLPDPLTAILSPLHYTLWEDPEDDGRLVTELIHALQHPPVPEAPVQPEKLEAIGGSVPLESQFYVSRPADEHFRAAITRRDSIVLIKGARQTGKTSLLARGLQEAREAGAWVAVTDLQTLSAGHLQSAEALYLALAQSVADQLDLEVFPSAVWDSRRVASINFQRYLQHEVLDKTTMPVVWGLDEVDRLFTCDFASEVFGMFRSLHNARSLNPQKPWSRLTLAMAYATEAYLFITDLNQSPFNVGTRLMLSDFTPEQVAELNHRYGAPLKSPAEIARLYRLVGGHPELVRRGLHEIATHGTPVTALEGQAFQNGSIFSDHLRRILVVLTRNPELCAVVREVLRGRPCPTEESFYRLRTAGLMAGESIEDAHLRCHLYQIYLQRHLG